MKCYFSCISVSPKGVQFLSACMPDHQPPLLLPVINDSAGEAEHKSTSGKTVEVNGMAPLKSEGLSEVLFSVAASSFNFWAAYVPFCIFTVSM